MRIKAQSLSTTMSIAHGPRITLYGPGDWDRLLDFRRIGLRVESIPRVLAARTKGGLWMGGGVQA